MPSKSSSAATTGQPTNSEPQRRWPSTLKKILSAGKGQLPDYDQNTKALFHYEVLLPPKPSGKVSDKELQDPEQARLRIFPEDRSMYQCVDTTKQGPPHGYGKPLELVFGKKFQLPLFEQCLRTMLVGEISQFDVFDPRELVTLPMVAKKLRDIARAEQDPVFARQQEHAQRHQCAASVTELGYPELDKLLKEGPRPARVIIELLSVFRPDQYARDNWQLDEVQRSAQVDKLREQGNQLFGEKEFNLAADKYREALTLLDQLLLREKPGDPEWLELDVRNVPLYLNLAQCYLNMGRFYDATNCADEALKREPDNEKALFRRAKARLGTWDLEEAEADIKHLTELGENSSTVAVVNLLKELDHRRKEKEEQERKACKAMFRGLSTADADQEGGGGGKEEKK